MITQCCVFQAHSYTWKYFLHKALLGLALTNNLGSCSSFSALLLWWCQGQSRTLRREAGLTQCFSRRLGWNTASGKSKTTPLPPWGYGLQTNFCGRAWSSLLEYSQGARLVGDNSLFIDLMLMALSF